MIIASRRLADAPFTILDSLRRHRVAAFAFVGLQLADVVSTHIGLKGDLNEANPLASGLLSSGGEGSMYAFKLAMVCTFLFLVCLLEARYPRIWRAVRVTSIVMALIVFTNVAQMFL